MQTDNRARVQATTTSPITAAAPPITAGWRSGLFSGGTIAGTIGAVGFGTVGFGAVDAVAVSIRSVMVVVAALQRQVEASDDGVGVINSDGPDVCHRLDLGGAVSSSAHRGHSDNQPTQRERGSTYTVLTWSSVMDRPNCPTRVFTAFQPVSLWCGTRTS